jgi:lysophospholipase L1-like esterase
MVFLQIGENDICQQYSASHTASEIIQLAKHIRRMGVSTVVIGSNIIRPTPRNIKETTYDRKKKKINKELNKVKESDIKYWRHQNSWQKPKYFDRDGVHLNDDGHFKYFCSIRQHMIERKRR